MPRRHQVRGVKVCPHCGSGYDGYKAMELRGRYCSPACLNAARAAHRRLGQPLAALGDVSSAVGS